MRCIQCYVHACHCIFVDGELQSIYIWFFFLDVLLCASMHLHFMCLFCNIYCRVNKESFIDLWDISLPY